MPKARYHTISDAARALGKEKNRKLLRRLIAFKKIETFEIGNYTCIDDAGLATLAEAVHEWDGRLRLKALAASA
jgi:hypothetical protein